MSPLRVLRGFIFGGIGGFLGWVLVEFLPPPFPSPPFRPATFEGLGPGHMPSMTAGVEGLIGLCLGLAIGGLLGISEGIAEGTMSRFRRVFLWFLGLGAVGGFLGLYFGHTLYGFLGGHSELPKDAADYLHQVLARSAGWTLIGLFLGVVFGAPNLSTRRMFNGAIGGAIGGFLGGFFFQTLTSSG